MQSNLETTQSFTRIARTFYDTQNTHFDHDVTMTMLDGFEGPVEVTKPPSKVSPHQCQNEKEMRTVGTAVVVTTFGDCDLLNHTFQAHLIVYLDWVATEAEVKLFANAGHSYKVDERQLSFRPHRKFILKNAVDSEWGNWASKRLFWSEKFGKYFIFTRASVKGTWREVYELDNFPLDIQNLTIKLQLGYPSKVAALVPVRCRPTVLMVQKKYSCLADCAVGNIRCMFTETSAKDSLKGSTYSQLHCCIKIVRRWESYAYRTFSIIMFVSFSTMACFSYEGVGSDPDRVAHVATMLLTAVAFQLIISSSLPNIPYMTYIDTFINAQFFFIFLVGCLIVGGDSSDEDAFNMILQIALGIWFLIQLVLALDGWRRRKREYRKLDRYVEEDSVELNTEYIRTFDQQFLTFSKGAMRDNVIAKDQRKDRIGVDLSEID